MKWPKKWKVPSRKASWACESSKSIDVGGAYEVHIRLRVLALRFDRLLISPNTHTHTHTNTPLLSLSLKSLPLVPSINPADNFLLEEV